MLRKNLVVLSAAIVSVFGFASMAAAEGKVGFVDVKTAVENTSDYKAGMKRLEALKNRKTSELEDLRKKVEAAQKELQSQALMMSQDRLAKKEMELKDMKKNFERQSQDAQEELMSEKGRLEQGIYTKFIDAVRELGKKEGYDYILGSAVAIYADPKLDVTAKITKALDKKK